MNKKVLLLTLCLISPAFGRVYIMEMNTNKDFVGITVNEGSAPAAPDQGLSAHVYSESGELLSSRKFQIPSEKFFDDFTRNESTGGIVKLTNSTFGVIIPYAEKGAKLTVYEESGGKLFSRDLTRFMEKEEEPEEDEEEEKTFKLWWIVSIVFVAAVLLLLIWLSKSRRS